MLIYVHKWLCSLLMRRCSTCITDDIPGNVFCDTSLVFNWQFNFKVWISNVKPILQSARALKNLKTPNLKNMKLKKRSSPTMIAQKKLEKNKNTQKKTSICFDSNPVTSPWWSRLVLVRLNKRTRKLRTGTFLQPKWSCQSNFFPLTLVHTHTRWIHDVTDESGTPDNRQTFFLSFIMKRTNKVETAVSLFDSKTLEKKRSGWSMRTNSGTMINVT